MITLALLFHLAVKGRKISHLESKVASLTDESDTQKSKLDGPGNPYQDNVPSIKYTFPFQLTSNSSIFASSNIILSFVYFLIVLFTVAVLTPCWRFYVVALCWKFTLSEALVCNL